MSPKSRKRSKLNKQNKPKQSNPRTTPKKVETENSSKFKRFFTSVWGVVVIISTIGGVIGLIVWLVDMSKRPGKEFEARYDRNSGVLEPKRTNEKTLVWPLGMGSVYFPDGIFDLQSVIPTLPDMKTLEVPKESPFKGVLFKAWLDNGKIKVTTQIRDPQGHSIADMVENEWSVNSPAYAYKRNFNDTSLEVIDHFNKVVFQIDISGNRVFLRGVFNRPDSLFVIANTHKARYNADTSALGYFIAFHKKDYNEIMSKDSSMLDIKPIFIYPSNEHKGQRLK